MRIEGRLPDNAPRTPAIISAYAINSMGNSWPWQSGFDSEPLLNYPGLKPINTCLLPEPATRMSVESWNPNQADPAKLNQEQLIEMLKRFVALAREQKLESLNDALSAEDKQQSQIIGLDNDIWPGLLEGFSNEDLLELIRFFTMVEMKISGWQAGEKSPVIVINKVLKSRGEKVDKELLQWIRKNSDNRFIPNGPIMF